MGALVKLVLSFFGGKTWLLIAAAIVGVYVGWLHLSIAGLKRDIALRDVTIERVSADLRMAQANVTAAVRINDSNVIELDRFRTDNAALHTIFAAELQRVEARCRIATRTQENIRRAQIETPATCPVAPSLRAAVDGLRDYIAGSADRDPDRAGDGQAAR